MYVLLADHVLMRDRKTGMAAQAWCDTKHCSLTCHIIVPRVSVRVDDSTQAFLDYWDQQQLLATFRETNVVSSCTMDLLTITQQALQCSGSPQLFLRSLLTNFEPRVYAYFRWKQ